MLLIKKPYSVGDTVSVKLSNGDELIARLDDENDESITLNRPLALTMANGGLGMIPWMFLGDSDNVTIRKTHIFAMMMSKKEAANQYTQGTTGIALA